MQAMVTFIVSCHCYPSLQKSRLLCVLTLSLPEAGLPGGSGFRLWGNVMRICRLWVNSRDWVGRPLVAPFDCGRAYCRGPMAQLPAMVGLLDNLAEIHNRYLITDVLDNTKIMRDKEIGESQVLL